MKTVVKTCTTLETSQDLMLFEKQYQKSKEYNLRYKLGQMRRYSELIVFKLNDIRDWQLLNKGTFKKHEIPFDLEQSLGEVKEFMLSKSKTTRINFIFDLNFD